MMIEKPYQQGIILKATYERTYEGILRIRLVIKMYEYSWGVANMLFIGDEKINELFDAYEKIHKCSIETQLCKFQHEEVYMPLTFNSTSIPTGICFNIDDARINNFVKNSNDFYNR